MIHQKPIYFSKTNFRQIWIQRYFFTVCNFVNNGINSFGNESMSWQNIKTLQQQGHDIESHTMTHTALYNRSQQV